MKSDHSPINRSGRNNSLQRWPHYLSIPSPVLHHHNHRNRNPFPPPQPKSLSDSFTPPPPQPQPLSDSPPPPPPQPQPLSNSPLLPPSTDSPLPKRKKRKRKLKRPKQICTSRMQKTRKLKKNRPKTKRTRKMKHMKQAYYRSMEILKPAIKKMFLTEMICKEATFARIAALIRDCFPRGKSFAEASYTKFNLKTTAKARFPEGASSVSLLRDTRRLRRKVVVEDLLVLEDNKKKPNSYPDLHFTSTDDLSNEVPAVEEACEGKKKKERKSRQ